MDVIVIFSNGLLKVVPNFSHAINASMEFIILHKLLLVEHGNMNRISRVDKFSPKLSPHIAVEGWLISIPTQNKASMALTSFLLSKFNLWCVPQIQTSTLMVKKFLKAPPISTTKVVIIVWLQIFIKLLK